MRLTLVLLLVLLGFSSPADSKGPRPVDRCPNFVFILVDDMGWADAGCLGSRFYQTPHIDRLAAEGMLSYAT